MEAKLKAILRKYYEEYQKLPKPDATQIGGTYYGSTQLFASVGNHMDFVEDGSHISYGYAGINTAYENACFIRIGGAYKLSTKDLYDELVAVAGETYVKETKLGIINDYGTHFSTIGFGYITH